MQDLRDALANMQADATAEDIQNVVYEIGRREPFLDMVKKGKDGRPGVSLDWFNMLYQVLLGQEKGPRFGSFVAVYGWLLFTSPSPRDRTRHRMPTSACKKKKKNNDSIMNHHLLLIKTANKSTGQRK